MSDCETCYNTIKALHLIHCLQKGGAEGLLLSTDAEKAFDRVSWAYLWELLSHVGIQPTMMIWMQALYAYPRAQVKIVGMLSPPLLLANGTRQGCPFSSLFFILSLEPLLRMVKAHPSFHGIAVGHNKYRIAAFADDLLFLTQPLVSMPNLMDVLDLYGYLSNFKINLSKS